MSDLDFATVRRIEETLASTALNDLVAVFSQKSTEHLLFVYNTEVCPILTANYRAITLDDLGRVDLQKYDGLLVGFSALDVIRDDLPTKGPQFHSLEDILLRLGLRPTLHNTMYNLACYLVTFLGDLSIEDSNRRFRTAIKILQLALPALLDKRGADNLIAVQPDSNLINFLDGRDGDWITLMEDPDTLVMLRSDAWIIALEELRRLNPQIDPKSRSFIELRGVLRRAGYTSALYQTCRTLAMRCAEEASSRPELWEPAWALMTEAWLAEEDVTDLVVFFPHAKFEHFAQTGEGLRVYRSLDEEARNLASGPRWTLIDLASRGVPHTFRPCSFSLVPLDSITEPVKSDIGSADLGRLLWKADHKAALAQTLLLLARDGLKNVEVVADLSPSTLSELARRAMLLISLGNPWTWRQGRQAQLVSNAYETLRCALLHQAESAKGTVDDYYRALVDWYDCHKVEHHDMSNLLHRMATRLRTFLRTTHRGESDSCVINARRLIEIEEAIRYPLTMTRQDEEVYPTLDARALPSDLGRVHGTLARRATEADCLSPVFEPEWGQLRHLRRERHQVQVRERSVDVQQRKLEKLLVYAKRDRQLVFAPPHEMNVLYFLYDREINDLIRRVHELKTEARLEIIPLNPRLDFQREEELAFEVHNIGRVEACNVEIVLARNQNFELLERSPIREFSSLLPGVPERFSYNIRSVHQPDVTFDFGYTYQGMDAQQKISIRLPVRSLDEAPFEIKGNPYIVGSAIQKPADFYGREREMRRLLSSLYGGGHTNFLLRGPRRMGKTSMLYVLGCALGKPAAWPSRDMDAWLDNASDRVRRGRVRRRFDIPENWDASLERYRPILLDLQEDPGDDATLHSDVSPLIRFFRRLLDATCAVAPDLRNRLLESFDERWKYIGTPRAVLEQLNEIFRYQPGARLLILLDEYDEIYQPKGRALDTALRHVVQREQRLTWIIASTKFLFKESKSHGSPWFNILDIVELDCLSNRAAQQLVERSGQSGQLAWQSDAIVALLEETGRHPFFLQLFCSKIMDHLNLEEQNYVLPVTIAEVAEKIVEEQETVHAHFESYWKDEEMPSLGPLILLATDEIKKRPTRLELQRWVQTQLQAHFGSKKDERVPDARDDPVPWWEREFQEGMDWVAGVTKTLSFDKVSRTYTFTVPLFHRWLQHKRRYEDLLDVALGEVEMKMRCDGLA